MKPHKLVAEAVYSATIGAKHTTRLRDALAEIDELRRRAEHSEAYVERLLSPTPKTCDLRNTFRGLSERDISIKLIAHASKLERHAKKETDRLNFVIETLNRVGTSGFANVIYWDCDGLDRHDIDAAMKKGQP